MMERLQITQFVRKILLEMQRSVYSQIATIEDKKQAQKKEEEEQAQMQLQYQQ